MNQRGWANKGSVGVLLSTLSVVTLTAVITLTCPITLSAPNNQLSTQNSSVLRQHPQIKPTKPPAASDLERILDRGTLRIATLGSPGIMYAGKSQDQYNPDQALASAFAKALGIKATYIVSSSREGVYATLSSGRADIAAGLTMTLERKHDFHFSETLSTTRQQLVCRRFGDVARTPQDLAQIRLDVTNDIANLTTLWTLEYRHSGIRWATHEDASQELMLGKVWNNETDCTLADSHIVAQAQRIMPELQVMFDTSEERPLAWVTRRGDNSLIKAANRWILGEGAPLIAAATKGYRSNDNFDYVDTRVLIRRMKTRFPQYRDLIEQAGRAYDIDPWLLAALSYQESHWDPHAQSPTGVRGLMMLTRNTAQALGVTNRLDPHQAIPAGAHYLATLRESFDATIPEPDRTYMALAAYNIGRARVHDAQQLTRKHGMDPHRWHDLKLILPQLCEQQPGACKGHRFNLGAEAVRYVDRIHSYRDIIDANRHERRLLAYLGSNLG